jgi:hypothetical protein
MDEYTADAWHDVLTREPWLSLDVARDAVVEVKRRQTFVDISDVITEAKRIRRRQRERQASERVIAPVRQRREQLDDPRPLRETIRAIIASHGRPELTRSTP